MCSKSYQLTPEKFNRSWRMVTLAGGLGAIFVATTTSAPLTKYLIELGFEPYHFGAIQAIASAVIVMQMLGGLFATRIKRRKAWWIPLTIIGRSAFFCVLAAPILFSDAKLRVPWALFMMFIQGAFIHFAEPLWFSWMADLLPKDTLNRHWAKRMRFTQTVRLVISFVLAGILYLIESSGNIIHGYMILGACGVLLGIMDISLFTAVPEPPMEQTGAMRIREVLTEPFRDQKFRSFLKFFCMWKFAIAFYVPYFIVFAMDGLGISATMVQILLTLMIIGNLVCVRFWGMFCDSFGHRNTIRVVTVGRMFFVLLLILCPTNRMIAVPLFALGVFIEGCAMGGTMMTFQTARIMLTPKKNRPMYIGTINLVSMGIATGIGAMISGATIKLCENMSIQFGPWQFTGYHVCFALFILFAGISWVLARNIYQPRQVSLKAALRDMLRYHPLKTFHTALHLHNYKNEGKRVWAVDTLGNLQNPLAFNDLISALQDPSPQVRGAVATAIGKLAIPEGIGPLALALQDPSSGIHDVAAKALGDIGGMESLKALLTHISRPVSDALYEAIDSLERIGDYAAVLPLICLFLDTDDKKLKERISAALGTLSGDIRHEAIYNALMEQR